MGKVYYYTFFASIIVLLLTMTGTMTDLNAPVTYENGAVNFGNIYDYLFGNAGILILAVTAGIAIAYFTQTTAENYIILPFITAVLALYFNTLVSLITYGGNFPLPIKLIIILILAPFTFGYVLSLVEFFRGND